MLYTYIWKDASKSIFVQKCRKCFKINSIFYLLFIIPKYNEIKSVDNYQYDTTVCYIMNTFTNLLVWLFIILRFIKIINR